MSRPDVLAVSRLSPVYTAGLERDYTLHERLHELDAAAFAAIAPRVRAVAASGDSRVSAELIGLLPALEFIAVMGVGYDGVDVAAARARGIRVSHTPGVLDDDVADLALALMLALARRIPQADRFVREGRWAEGAMPLARKLTGARLGLVGMGRIGQAIALRAQALRMPTAYTARTPKPALPYPYYPNARELAAESDFLVVITPGGAGTRHLIDAEVLAALGPQGYLVNVARGSVVDEAALVQAVERGAIAGAALDVFDNEPQVPEALRRSEAVVLTPHIGSATADTRRAMAELALANLSAHFSGAAPPSLVPECR